MEPTTTINKRINAARTPGGERLSWEAAVSVRVECCRPVKPVNGLSDRALWRPSAPTMRAILALIHRLIREVPS